MNSCCFPFAPGFLIKFCRTPQMFAQWRIPWTGTAPICPAATDSSSPSLGAALRARRRTLNLTQEELSDLAGVGLRLVHEVEHDKETVQLVNLLRLLGALGLLLELKPGAANRVQTGYLL